MKVSLYKNENIFFNTTQSKAINITVLQNCLFNHYLILLSWNYVLFHNIVNRITITKSRWSTQSCYLKQDRTRHKKKQY